MSVPVKETRVEVNQADYAVLALLRVGGSEGMVDLEHVAVEAHRLAPQLFRWRHYDLPDVEKVRKAFKDVERRGNGRLVIKDHGGRGRMLTAEGLSRARSVEGALGANSLAQDGALRRPVNRELAQMERHPGFLKWKQDGLARVDRYDLADMLACAPGSSREVFLDRIDRARTLASEWGRDELASFLKQLTVALSQVLGRAS